jgi:hypothetical protein
MKVQGAVSDTIKPVRLSMDFNIAPTNKPTMANSRGASKLKSSIIFFLMGRKSSTLQI